MLGKTVSFQTRALPGQSGTHKLSLGFPSHHILKTKSSAAHFLPGRGKWEGTTHPNKKEAGKTAVANSNPALVLTLHLSGVLRLHIYTCVAKILLAL